MVGVVMDVLVAIVGVIAGIGVVAAFASTLIDIWRCARGGKRRDFGAYLRELDVKGDDPLSYAILWCVLCHYEPPAVKGARG